MDISVAIVHYKTKELLAECLKSIFDKTSAINFEIIVVDNKSQDGTIEMLKESFPQVKLICNYKNLGFSKAVNQAFKLSQGDYFFILNPDTEIVNNAIFELFNFMKVHPEVAVAGPRLIFPDGKVQMSCRRFMTLSVAILDVFPINAYFSGNIFLKRFNYGYWKHEYIRGVDWVTGAAFMTRRDLYQKINMFDERFFIYAEDMDYCLKARKAGYKVFFMPEAVVMHYHAKGGTQFTYSRKVDYYQSLYLYIKKNLNSFKAIIFRISVVVWAFIYLIIRLIETPFLTREKESVIKHLQIPLRLLMWKGHEA